jgi:3,4-dihydroxy 2-butanone 4-phosphate synthase
MVEENTSQFHSAFTDSIEAARGITKGVSAHDRLVTVRAAIADGAKPEDLRRPGHVFPLQSRNGGVLERPGHTEAVIDLMRLAGLPSFGVACELTNPDGSLAQLEQIMVFAEKEGYPIVTVEDLIEWRNDHPE